MCRTIKCAFTIFAGVVFFINAITLSRVEVLSHGAFLGNGDTIDSTIDVFVAWAGIEPTSRFDAAHIEENGCSWWVKDPLSAIVDCISCKKKQISWVFLSLKNIFCFSKYYIIWWKDVKDILPTIIFMGDLLPYTHNVVSMALYTYNYYTIFTY